MTEEDCLEIMLNCRNMISDRMLTNCKGSYIDEDTTILWAQKCIIKEHEWALRWVAYILDSWKPGTQGWTVWLADWQVSAFLHHDSGIVPEIVMNTVRDVYIKEWIRYKDKVHQMRLPCSVGEKL